MTEPTAAPTPEDRYDADSSYSDRAPGGAAAGPAKQGTEGVTVRGSGPTDAADVTEVTHTSDAEPDADPVVDRHRPTS